MENELSITDKIRSLSKAENIISVTGDLELEESVNTLLNDLGFNMESIESVYLSQVISCALKDLESTEYEEVIKNLSEPYSQFYFNLAKNINGVGVKTFLKNLMNAFCVRKGHNSLKNKINPLADDIEDNFDEIVSKICCLINAINTVNKRENGLIRARVR